MKTAMEILGYLALFLIIFFFGVQVGHWDMQKTLAEKGVGFYHGITGKFEYHEIMRQSK